ncbi:hypothetical protein ACOMHN_043428 [Nucella lapillus]
MRTSTMFVLGCMGVTVYYLLISSLSPWRGPAPVSCRVPQEARGVGSGTAAGDVVDGPGEGSLRQQRERSELSFQSAGQRPPPLPPHQGPDSSGQSRPKVPGGPPAPSGGHPAQSGPDDHTIQAGAIPNWWLKSWSRSAVYNYRDHFAGDRPLFPSCLGGAKPSKSTLFTFVKPPEVFLSPNVSKNPCWYKSPSTQEGLHCAPYMYLAGVAKCGTSDLYRRLKQHPEFFNGTQKEYHWWERTRYGHYKMDDPEKTVDAKSGETFKEYLKMITGEEINDIIAELKQNGSSVRIFGDFSPSYMWDPHNWYVLDGNQGCDEPRVVVGQHIRHFWPPAKILMTFRHPTPRLYSRFLSRIHRIDEFEKVTNVDFHEFVKHGVQLYNKCFEKHSIRRCAYDVGIYRNSKVRLVEGMYPVFMQDWLRIWPREQIFIMRYEDYQGHEGQRMKELFHFLGLGHVDSEVLEKIEDIPIVNSGSEEYQKYGSMLPETKHILDKFYQPFVDQFAKILNDQRFLWKDVYK